MTILDEILERKRGEVAQARAQMRTGPVSSAAASAVERTRGFRSALAGGARPPIIAEIKRRSPSKGLIRKDFEPVVIAQSFVSGGAAAISVLTDEHFFGGELAYLERVRRAVSVPLLRKDFVVDVHQIDEARVAGADAVLLIVAALEVSELTALRDHARALTLDVLVEVHDEAELEVALSIGADLIGVNNRDLRTFEVDLSVTERLAARVDPDQLASGDIVLVAESGIRSPEDIVRLERAGACAFLVGESLMREPDLAEALAKLRRTQ